MPAIDSHKAQDTEQPEVDYLPKGVESMFKLLRW